MPGSYGEVCPLPIRRDKKQVLIGKFPERRIESTPSNRSYGLLAVYIDNCGWRIERPAAVTPTRASPGMDEDNATQRVVLPLTQTDASERAP